MGNNDPTPISQFITGLLTRGMLPRYHVVSFFSRYPALLLFLLFFDVATRTIHRTLGVMLTDLTHLAKGFHHFHHQIPIKTR